MAPALLAALVLAFPAAHQEERKPADVLQLQSGNLIVGRVTEFTADLVRIKVDGEAEARLVPIGVLTPYCVYRLRLDRIDREDPSARFALGEYCLAHDFLRISVAEFTESVKIHSGLPPEARKGRSETRMKERRALVTYSKALLADEKPFTAREILELAKDPEEGAPAVPGVDELEAKIARAIPATPAAAFEKGLALFKAAEAAGEKLDRENPFANPRAPLTHGRNVKSKFTRVLHLPATAELLISADALDLLKEKSDSKDPAEQAFGKACLKVLSCPDRLREARYFFLPAPLKGEYAVYYYR